MRGMTAFGQVLAFTSGQLALVLSIALLIALTIGLVIVSIVFGGNRRRGGTAQPSLPAEQVGVGQRQQE